MYAPSSCVHQIRIPSPDQRGTIQTPRFKGKLCSKGPLWGFMLVYGRVRGLRIRACSARSEQDHSRVSCRLGGWPSVVAQSVMGTAQLPTNRIKHHRIHTDMPSDNPEFPALGQNVLT